MKLLTLNVWQGRLGKIMADHLRTLDIDIACLQEAVAFDGRTGGLFTSYEKLTDSLQHDNQYFSPTMTTRFDDKPLSWGNAVSAKLPFSADYTIFTRGAYAPEFNFATDDYNIRAFQHVSIMIDGRELHILNHHGHHIDAHKHGDDETLRQINQIATYIDALQGPVILSGDFNLSPDSASINVLSDALRNLSTEFGLKTTRSSLTSKAEVCDYIFVNDEVTVNGFHMDDTIVSDHNILQLDFSI